MMMMISTRSVPNCNTANLSSSSAVQSNKAAGKVSGVASDAGKQITGAADQAKGNVGASGGPQNPIAGRTSDTVDKVIQSFATY